MAVRVDLVPYVDSPRYALTWDDVSYYESIGRPYPFVRKPADADKPVDISATWRAFTTLFGLSS